MLLFFLSCDSSTPKPLADETFQVIFVSDSHVIGPQYTCCSESEGIDNDSIMKTADRLQKVVDQINQMDPAPDLVFMMGDVVHDAYSSEDFSWYAENRNAFTVAVEILNQLNMPFYPAFGNHDYHYRCDESGHSKELSHQLFQSFFGVEPYYSIPHKGWNFIVANSQMGPSWTAGDPRCDTGKGSYGQEQLSWLDQQLQNGDPAIVMGHHMLPVTMREENEGEHTGMESVLANRSETMKGFFVGHTHRWIDFTASYGFPHFVMGATRYDEDNFWLLSL